MTGRLSLLSPFKRVLLLFFVSSFALFYQFPSATGRASAGGRATAQPEPISIASFLRLRRLPSVGVFDVRSRADYNLGHVPDAMSLPLSELNKMSPSQVLSLVGERTNIIVYCEEPSCLDSIKAANQLSRVGSLTVHIYYNGWREWRQLGLPELIK